VIATLGRWLDATVLDLGRQMRWSYVPPLMVYLAAGISGLTAIVGTFFVKERLALSATFLAALGFWTGIPWVLKMPLGHVVDLAWRWKSLLVYLGAGLIAASIAIMYGLIAQTAAMRAILPAETWYVVSALLAPVGYVIQDVVADAMTVEAVPSADASGRSYGEDEIKRMHTTMQTLGRFAIVAGGLAVAVLNIVMFADVAGKTATEVAAIYARLYLLALLIPAVSVVGVVLAAFLRPAASSVASPDGGQALTPNWELLGGGLVFAVVTIGVGLADLALGQELIFVGTLVIVLFLMARLLRALPQQQRRALIGTAVIVFVFRAVPLPGAGATWWQIDVLGFDQHFLSVLTLITTLLALAGMLLLRPFMATTPIAKVVAILALVEGAMWLPNVGLYHGLHEWTARHTGGVVDARFIAILDTALESPLSQVAMIPMLAWIAKNAPARLKATFFAVMASFVNLALSASSLGTKYLNQVFLVSRAVRDPASGAIIVPAAYGELGGLLLTVAIVAVLAPLATIAVVQRSPLRTRQ